METLSKLDHIKQAHKTLLYQCTLQAARKFRCDCPGTNSYDKPLSDILWYTTIKLSKPEFITKMQMNPSNCTSANEYYEIDYTRQSHFALLLFARHTVTDEHIVIKILRKYKDTRYSLETRAERQQFQVEALHWNRVFTPKVYIGLAPVCNLDLVQKSIGIGKVISNPVMETLESSIEYALLMHQLADERRLDFLLEKENEVSLRHCLRLLTKRLSNVHTSLAGVFTHNGDGMQWGSFEQLKRKLEHNLAFIKTMLNIAKSNQYEFYDWLEGILNMLQKSLTQVFTQSRYPKYFEQRVQEGHIKRCHGDLKTPNIWIAPYNPSCDESLDKCISILDVIDFYPMYSNIDILSDFALLIVDIQARTKSLTLADSMIEDYLKFIKQQDEASSAVLAYYLVEKALVGAAISIIYDSMPELAKAFLKVAEMRTRDLKRWLDI